MPCKEFEQVKNRSMGRSFPNDMSLWIYGTTCPPKPGGKVTPINCVFNIWSKMNEFSRRCRNEL